MVERYCAATGRDGVPDLNWYFAYNLFRLTGIVQGIKKRIVDGTASSAQATEATRRLAAAAWSLRKRRAWNCRQRSGAGRAATIADSEGEMDVAIRSDRKGRHHHRLVARASARRSPIELAEHGAKVVISSRKQDACDAVAAEINAKHGAGHRDRGRRQHLRQGGLAEPGRRNPPRLRPDRHPRLQRRVEPLLRPAWKALPTSSSARSSTTTSCRTTG